VEEQRKALDVGLDQKAKHIQESIIVPNNEEKGMEDVDPMEVDGVFAEHHFYEGDSDSSDNEETLLAKIESAKFSLNAKSEELQNLKEHEVNPTALDFLKQRLKSLTHLIEERDKDFDAFKKNRDRYLKKRNSGKVSIMDHYLLWESKLETLRRRRTKAENERRTLNVQIIQKEKEHYNDVVQHVSELEVLALAPTYGGIPEELETLHKLVEFHESRVKLMDDEFSNVKAKSQYHTQWIQWKRNTIGKEDEEYEKCGPEPILNNFVPKKDLARK
jgi:hypothetical protein